MDEEPQDLRSADDDELWNTIMENKRNKEQNYHDNVSSKDDRSL